MQGLFLRGGPHYLCGKREESAIASHGHGKGASHEVIHVENNPVMMVKVDKMVKIIMTKMVEKVMM